MIRKKLKNLGGKLKKPRPGSYDYQLQETMKPPYKRKEVKKGGKALKPVDKEKNPGLAKLPTQVRNKMGYMKKGGRVKKFPDLSGDGKVTKKDILMGRGVIKKKKMKEKAWKRFKKPFMQVKEKRGGKMRKKGAKGAPTAAKVAEQNKQRGKDND